MNLRPRTPKAATSWPGRCSLAGAAALTVVLGGCGWADDGRGGDGTTLRVLAASSLTDVFEELAATFEDRHPGIDVELSFGSSTDLAEQAADGAPGDVLATADAESMSIAREAGVLAGGVELATNALVIVTPPDDPGQVASLGDLDGATWVRCADAVPCGRAARFLLQRAGVTADPASMEEDARSALDKVTSGEADAGLVYRSDAVSAGDDVRTVEIPGADATANLYYIAGIDDSAGHEPARDFIQLVLGPEGDAALTRAGFRVVDPDPRDPVP